MMMASYGDTVTTDFACAIIQSIGAPGQGVIGSALASVGGAVVAGGAQTVGRAVQVQEVVCCSRCRRQTREFILSVTWGSTGCWVYWDEPSITPATTNLDKERKRFGDMIKRLKVEHNIGCTHVLPTQDSGTAFMEPSFFLSPTFYSTPPNPSTLDVSNTATRRA